MSADLREEFTKWYFGDFHVERDPLYELAEEYDSRCEAYDQLACSGMRDGVAMPATTHELFLINRNALKVIGDIVARTGCDKRALRKAIQDLNKQAGAGFITSPSTQPYAYSTHPTRPRGRPQR